MNLFCSEFKRKFSVSMYKNLKIKLGEMTFSKDFVSDTRGDLYPVMQKSDDCVESIENNLYTIRKGTVKRLFCQFFPFATYEVTGNFSEGEVGFCFKLANTEARITVIDNKLTYTCETRCEEVGLPGFVKAECTLIVSCRPGAFDVYLKNNGKPEYLCTFYDGAFQDSNQYSLFSNGYVFLLASRNVIVREVLSYIDNGVSIADIRPIKYENGEVLQEQGNIYFTASVRMQEGTFQGFEHEHILAHAAFEGDPRFGVNVVDVEIMRKASDTSDISAFAGFKGDEDPDFFYDKENDRWIMAICRLNPKTKQYVYVFFESKYPFEGYTYIGQGYDGAETGGSFVKIDGELFFVCGNDFKATSEYRIYSKHGMQKAKFNYPDGGFRGWGTVIPIKKGSRTRYFWLTFDRHNGSKYNWSYGNIYCFELGI